MLPSNFYSASNFYSHITLPSHVKILMNKDLKKKMISVSSLSNHNIVDPERKYWKLILSRNLTLAIQVSFHITMRWYFNHLINQSINQSINPSVRIFFQFQRYNYCLYFPPWFYPCGPHFGQRHWLALVKMPRTTPFFIEKIFIEWCASESKQHEVCKILVPIYVCNSCFYSVSRCSSLSS